MPRIYDVSCGCRIGRWTVIQKSASQKGRWECRCDCGTVKHIITQQLTDGDTHSCGCAKAERIRKARTVHGHTKHGGDWSPEYAAWAAMMGRCYTKSNTSYATYGGAGIAVCERWHTFANFLADMGRKPSRRHSLDRFPDGTGDYVPKNCRWASPVEQGNNQRTNRRLTFQGQTKTLAEWGRHTGIRSSTILARIRTGWSVGRALTTPIRGANV